MAIALVQSTSVLAAASATTIALAFASNVTNGNFIVIAVNWQNTGISVSTVADGTNTYSSITAAAINNVIFTQIWYTWNITNGGTAPTITVTFSAAAVNRSLSIHEYSGVQTSADPKDKNAQTNNQTVNSNAADFATTGSVLPATDGQLIFGASKIHTSATGLSYNAGTNFTERTEVQQGGGYPFETESFVQATAASLAATWTVVGTTGPSTQAQHVMATFKAAAGAAEVLPGHGPLLAGLRNRLIQHV